jgi:hypothetical protein
VQHCQCGQQVDYLTLPVNHLCNTWFRPLTIIVNTLHYSVHTGIHKHVHSDDLVGDAIPCDLPQHHFPLDPNPPHLTILHHPFSMLLKALLCFHKVFNQHLSKCCLGAVIRKLYFETGSMAQSFDILFLYYVLKTTHKVWICFLVFVWHAVETWDQNMGICSLNQFWHYVSYLFVTSLHFCN